MSIYLNLEVDNIYKLLNKIDNLYFKKIIIRKYFSDLMYL